MSNKVVFYSESEVLNFPSCLRSCTALTWIIPLREWSFIMSILFRLREGCNMKHLDMQITNYSFDIKWGSSAYKTSHPASLNCVSHTLNRLLCLLNSIHSSGCVCKGDKDSKWCKHRHGCVIDIHMLAYGVYTYIGEHNTVHTILSLPLSMSTEDLVLTSLMCGRLYACVTTKDGRLNVDPDIISVFLFGW